MTDETPGQWQAVATPPLAAPVSSSLSFSEVASAVGEPDVDVAYRWAKMYEKDIEYEPFFNWIGRRMNPERTDRREILESLPLHWGPEDLPPPLRRFFLRRFSK